MNRINKLTICLILAFFIWGRPLKAQSLQAKIKIDVERTSGTIDPLLIEK